MSAAEKMIEFEKQALPKMEILKNDIVNELEKMTKSEHTYDGEIEKIESLKRELEFVKKWIEDANNILKSTCEQS